jgi:hypothetical protein
MTEYYTEFIHKRKAPKPPKGALSGLEGKK